MSQALNEPYIELREALPQEPILGVDETGHPECGKKFWTWCFKADEFAMLFHLFQESFLIHRIFLRNTKILC